MLASSSEETRAVDARRPHRAAALPSSIERSDAPTRLCNAVARSNARPSPAIALLISRFVARADRGNRLVEDDEDIVGIGAACERTRR